MKFIFLTKQYIRPLERKALFGKEWEVKSGLINYIEKYKNARLNPNKHLKVLLCRYSTLQYFEKHIFHVDENE